MSIRRLGYVTVGILLAACSATLDHESPFDPDSPAALQAKASLTSHVGLEGESDAGGVGVRLASAERTYQFTTSNDGAVAIPGIVPGRYTLTVSTRYFAPIEREIEFELGENKKLDALALELRAATVEGNALAMSVVDKKEVRQGGVKILLTKIASIRENASSAPAFRAAAEITDSVTFTTVSAPDGSYTIDNVDAGVYQVTASSAGVAAQEAGTVSVTGDGAVAASDVLLLPLTGFFSIRGIAADGPSELYTGTSNVQLQLSGFNATKMKIGRSAGGTSAGCVYLNEAVTYESAYPYIVPAPGLETVCVRFVDKAGAETDDILGTIAYDNQAPQLPSISINDGAPATGTLSNGVRFSAVETETTLHAYQVANSLPGDWNSVPKYAFQPNILHALTGGGIQTVYARFQDAAGNWTAAVSASIEVSTQTPTVNTSSIIDDAGGTVAGGATTRSSRVYVTSNITSETTLQMQISTNGSYTGVAWESYAASKPLDLAPQAGHAAEARQISARVRDAVGRVIEIFTNRALWLDNRGPTGTVAAPALVNSLDVPLTLAVNDAGASVEIAENPTFVGAVSFAFQAATTYTLVTPLEGLRTIYVRFLDAAGNASAVASAAVQVDSTPPQLASSRFARAYSPTRLHTRLT